VVGVPEAERVPFLFVSEADVGFRLITAEPSSMAWRGSMMVRGKSSPTSLVAETALPVIETRMSAGPATDAVRAELFSRAWRGNPRVMGRSSPMSLVT
jgi:hypothetical protein